MGKPWDGLGVDKPFPPSKKRYSIFSRWKGRRAQWIRCLPYTQLTGFQFLIPHMVTRSAKSPEQNQVWPKSTKQLSIYLPISACLVVSIRSGIRADRNVWFYQSYYNVTQKGMSKELLHLLSRFPVPLADRREIRPSFHSQDPSSEITKAATFSMVSVLSKILSVAAVPVDLILRHICLHLFFQDTMCSVLQPYIQRNWKDERRGAVLGFQSLDMCLQPTEVAMVTTSQSSQSCAHPWRLLNRRY